MVLSRLLRAGEGKMLKRLRAIAVHINELEDDTVALSDAELRDKTDEFKRRHNDGEELDELLPEAFAVVREAARRVLGQRHFEVQLMGGAALHLGQIAEMKTGEGKTLTCVLPAYLNAIADKGVHVITVNDYLARRDAEWMGRVHRFLGLTVAPLLAEMPPEQRREAYEADVTYGTNNEFGFDYLRDNMAWSLDDCVQRGHNFAVVDEVDSILIDEARTPLIISGPADQSSRWYNEFARLAPMFERDVHYDVDERKRTIGITEEGAQLVEDQLGIENLYEAANTPLVGYLNNAIKAKELYKRDKDYIIRNGEVMIVDEFTGRVLAGRRYNEGMHQAIEAKEGVEIKAENQTLASITLQNYFRLYDKLSGMTGTAQTEASEFQSTYKLGVVTVPTNEPMIRKDQPDVVYKTETAKFDALAEDIQECYQRRQPVLVGTTSVEHSEHLSKLLTKMEVPHNVLNAKHHESEATIIADAGRKGSVTVATNMAGRGTDIVLGGNVDHLADVELRNRGLDPVHTPEDYENAWPGVKDEMEKQAKAEADDVREVGGLYVLGTERHESRRIDNQLRGRSGRQGDPGQSRFYLSLGDELMRRFNSNMVETIMTRFKVPDDVPIEAKMVTRAIRSAQTQVEQQNMEIRKNVLQYDEVMNQQRMVIYSERRRVLEGEDLRPQITHMLSDVISAYVNAETSGGYAEDWDFDKLWGALKTLYPVSLDWEELMDTEEDLSRERLLELLVEDAREAYDKREAEVEGKVGTGAMRELERRVVLSVLDRKWREHLYEMDYLKEGIGLRAMAQRDPLMEYRREGFDMFHAMLEALKEESVSFLFNVQVEAAEPTPQSAPAAAGQPPTTEAASSGTTRSGAQSNVGTRQVQDSEQGNGSRGGGRHQAQQPRAKRAQQNSAGPALSQLGNPLGDDGHQAPSGMSGNGLDGSQKQGWQYSGPTDNGDSGETGGGTRRERRAAARAESRKNKSRKQ